MFSAVNVAMFSPYLKYLRHAFDKGILCLFINDSCSHYEVVVSWGFYVQFWQDVKCDSVNTWALIIVGLLMWSELILV